MDSRGLYGGSATRVAINSDVEERLPRKWMLAGALAGLSVAGFLWITGYHAQFDTSLIAGTLVVLVPAAWLMFHSLLQGNWGVDLLGVIAILAALIVGEYLAAAIVATMLSSGYALEEYARGRAQAELSALISRVPTIAHRKRGTSWEEIPVQQIRRHDQLLIRAGDTVAADGILLGQASLDQSAMTGESIIVERAQGSEVLSGVVNAGEAFEILVIRSAADSAYDAVIELVRRAQQDRAPFVRLADRYARWFLPLSLVLALASWVWSGDAVRFVAVLVVATPCPLILAAPIALVAGLSCAAREGIVVKNGGALERISRAKTLMVDKTGTLTLGEPRVTRVEARHGFLQDQILALAASLEQFSAHVVAEALVHYAEDRHLQLLRPQSPRETPGQGICGELPGGQLLVGSPSWLEEQGRYLLPGEKVIGETQIGVVYNQTPVGSVFLSDQLRHDAQGTLLELGELGINKRFMLTGDQGETAQRIASQLPLDRVYAALSPKDKMDLVVENSGGEDTLIMLGDGINDAPALALADIGIAMGSKGSAASAQSADIVILEDRLSLVARVVEIGKSTLVIARQSVRAGMILSIAAMIVAFLGYLPPALGAILQEGIDIAVILNALRALKS